MVTEPVPPASSPHEPTDLADLPDAVRTRVVSLAAEALPQVAGLPAALRHVADFAPARRTRLGGSAIATALGDDDLRERISVQVAARPARDDEVDAAARAWLERGDSWSELVARASTVVADRADVRAAEREEAGLDRLRGKLAEAEAALKDARAKARSEVVGYKADNATLRRKLGDARTAEREARAAAEQALGLAEEARARAAALEAGQDKELRRLRARVEQLEAEDAASRRTSRADRDEATVRARLLLDAVIDAASGLRRELALPAVEGAPADRVEATLAESDSRAVGSAGPGSAAMLEQVLTLPRSRLIIDGYNVSKSAWPESSLESQRQRLLRALAPVVSRTGAETTVVFDAARLTNRPVVAAPRGVKVVFSPPDVIADDVIRDLVAAEPVGRTVVVVTDDQEVVRDIKRAGARPASAQSLLALLPQG